MGSNGSQGPKPWVQREARTAFLRVPFPDWPLIVSGYKTEFRASSGSVSGLKWVEPPLPVVAYTHNDMQGYFAKLMVLEERWQEPLAAISEESLEREGFDSFEEFRAYWCSRERRRFTPTRMVVAYRVRPFRFDGADAEEFADKLFDHLYGAFKSSTEITASDDLG